MKGFIITIALLLAASSFFGKCMHDAFSASNHLYHSNIERAIDKSVE